MCKCNENKSVCQCPVAVDWTRPLQINNVPSLILLNVSLNPHNKLLRIVTAISKESSASGFTYPVCSETGKHTNKDYNIINAPTPKKKLTAITLMQGGLIKIVTEDAFNKFYKDKPYKVLKTEEFEYE